MSEEKAFTKSRLLLKSTVEILILLGLFGPTELGLLACTLVVSLNTVVVGHEWICKSSSAAIRCATLLIGLVLGFLIFWGYPDSVISFSAASALTTTRLSIICSILLCIRECNFVIRWFFEQQQLVEKLEDPEPKTRNGRIIGNLERLLLLFFLWQGAAIAATFIVAVKELARFKKNGGRTGICRVCNYWNIPVDPPYPCHLRAQPLGSDLSLAQSNLSAYSCVVASGLDVVFR
ncbi:MAG: hypothetical protein AAF558_01545 [Verrucomicrobiota bacterium]